MNEVTFPATALQLMADIRDNYSSHLKTFFSFMEGRAPCLESVADYFRQLNASGLAASTVKLRRAAVLNRLKLLSRFGSLEEQALITQALGNLCESIRPSSSPPKDGTARILTEAQYLSLLRGSGRRLSLLLQFLYVTGVRVSEMCAVRPDDIVVEDDQVWVLIHGKGKRERRIFIHPDLYWQIHGTFGGKAYLFETLSGKPYNRTDISHRIEKASRRLIGRRVSSHSLRHTWATDYIRDTRDVKAASVWLGHSSSSTTNDYYNHSTVTMAQAYARYIS